MHETSLRPGTSRRPRLLSVWWVALFGFATACSGGSSVEELVTQAAASITPAELRAHVEFLADDLLEGRETGTRGMELAARYVAAAYGDLELEPAGDDGGYVQEIPMLRSVLDGGSSRLSIGGLAAGAALEYGRDWVGSPCFVDAGSTLEGELVFVGYGVEAPALGHDDYTDLDLTGKIAVALWGAPPSMPPDAAAHFASDKRRAARDRGAIGLLHLATPALQALAPWEFFVRIRERPAVAWLDERGRPFGLDRMLLGVATLSMDSSRALMEAAGMSLEAAIEAASQPGAGREVPLTARLQTFSRIEEVVGRNVVARVSGTEPDSAEAVVITAHLDHDGIGPPRDGDAIYNGAVDNAAGVAALLEIAEAVTMLPTAPRTIYFVATDAEEKGLFGAEYWIANPPVPVERVVANVNLDGNHMLFPTRDVIVLGADRSSLAPLASAAAEAEGLEVSPDPMPEQGFFTRSDHYPFVQRGVPAAFLIGGFQSRDPAVDGPSVMQRWLATTYHTPFDDLGQDLAWESGASYARVALRIARRVATDSERPTWNAGDFFGETFGADRIAPS